MDDPFDVFGDDANEEDEIEGCLESCNADTELARLLVAQANRQGSLVSKDGPQEASMNHTSSAPSPHPLPTNDAISGKVASSLDTFEIPWEDPLYKGSIRLVSSLPVGGGRGYVAAEEDLLPGSLVLIEKPIIAWPEGEASSVDLERIQVILLQDNANEIVRAMESFHPTRITLNSKTSSDVAASNNPSQVEDMIEMYRQVIQDDDLRLRTILKVAAAKGVTNSDESRLTELDVLRMLVALRYNSLETGVYLHVAMLNHADIPNCVKFRPADDKDFSEVRTTRHVKENEALTISYIPRLKCHASRRQHLWEQHRFDIGELKDDSEFFVFEHIGGKIPSITDMEVMQNIENACVELEDQCRELSDAAVTNNGELTEEDVETAQALELTALELCASARHQLQNEKHILLLPCLALHLDACDIVQRYVQLPKQQRARLTARLVVTGRKLAELQKDILGPDHFDLARTMLDVAQGIQELLSENPKELFAQDKSVQKTVHAWSLLEHEFRHQHTRIKNLYPLDASQHI